MQCFSGLLLFIVTQCKGDALSQKVQSQNNLLENIKSDCYIYIYCYDFVI